MSIHHIMPLVRTQGAKPVSIPAAPPRSDAEVEVILKICADCLNNFDDACQHPGCKVCVGRQRKIGGLAAMIRQPGSRCPDGRWKI
jgi:hypothetical protein